MKHSRDHGIQSGPWRVVALALAVFVAGWFNWRVPVIRFAWPLMNLITFVALMMLPSVAVVAAFRAWPRWLGVTVAVVLALPALGALSLGALTTFLVPHAVRTGVDPSFELVRELPVGDYNLRVYRTSGGARARVGVVVRQERMIVPGIRLVRDVYGNYPADDVTIETVGPHEYVFDGHGPGRLLRAGVWF